MIPLAVRMFARVTPNTKMPMGTLRKMLFSTNQVTNPCSNSVKQENPNAIHQCKSCQNCVCNKISDQALLAALEKNIPATTNNREYLKTGLVTGVTVALFPFFCFGSLMFVLGVGGFFCMIVDGVVTVIDSIFK